MISDRESVIRQCFHHQTPATLWFLIEISLVVSQFSHFSGMKTVFLLLFCASLSSAFDGRIALQQVAQKRRAFDFISEVESESHWTESANRLEQFSFSELLSVFNRTNTARLSTECREDLLVIMNAVSKPKENTDFLKTALVPMLDSNGKKGPGILRGHAYFAGLYQECKSVDYQLKDRERHFTTEYFRIDVDPFFRPNSKNGSCALVVPFVMDIEIFWEIGMCLPASCSSTELQNILNPEGGSAVDNPVCKVEKNGDTSPGFDAGFYITVSIMGIIFLICVLSGLIDFYFGEKLNRTSLKDSLPWRLFMSCSLYTNIGSIFDVSEAAKGGQIGPIHCIRFFSMVWVLMSHLFSSYLAVVANPDDILALVRDLSSEVIINGFYSVDSFFFMSGVLLAFLWFKTYQRQPKETMSVYGWIMFYVHRFLRLSPPYYMLIAFFTFVLNQMLRNSPINMNPIVTADSCRETWWVEFLYLHNYIDHERPCLGYSWYLAADMQIFLFTPFILIPLALKPVVGLLVCAIFFIISTGTNIFLVYYYHWPANQGWFHPKDPEQINMANYNMLMYDSPLIRCQIYIIGILVGWFLQTKKQLKIHPIFYLAAWVIGLSLMLTVLLGLHDQTNGTEIGIFWRAMYSALSRPAWGLGLSTIVILCYYGYGGPINSFMSWHIWVPLGRLCYCGYLIHIPVINLVLGQTKNEVYFSTFLEFFITRVVAVVACTFFFATFWSACFEINAGKIEKLLIGGIGTKKKPAI